MSAYGELPSLGEEIFGPKVDPLVGVTAEEVGPEIAEVLKLPGGQNVIREVEDFIRRYAVLPTAAYLPLALWAVATYLANSFDSFPYVALLSPVKRCGKTRVLELLELICGNVWRGVFPSAAAMYRMMAETPTLLLDEVEALRGGKQVSEVSQAVLSVLNAGYRKGATVPRCDGPKNELRYFPVYGPKAFAAIGDLPDTLADRCIRMPMQRRTAAQPVERFLQVRARSETGPLRESLVRWSQVNRKDVETFYREAPDLTFLQDRESEIWMPLFALCSVAAPERVGELKECALTLTQGKAADDVNDSLKLKLLADVRTIWPEGSANILTESLLRALKEIPDSPWGEPRNELTARGLAQMLRPFGPEPRQVRVATESGKGYVRDEFKQAFSRYLPDSDL